MQELTFFDSLRLKIVMILLLFLMFGKVVSHPGYLEVEVVKLGLLILMRYRLSSKDLLQFCELQFPSSQN